MKKIVTSALCLLLLTLSVIIVEMLLLVNRKETRGAFLQIDEYTLDNFQVLNPHTLSEKEKSMLFKTFNEIKNTDFPSIL